MSQTAKAHQAETRLAERPACRTVPSCGAGKRRPGGGILSCLSAFAVGGVEVAGIGQERSQTTGRFGAIRRAPIEQAGVRRLIRYVCALRLISTIVRV